MNVLYTTDDKFCFPGLVSIKSLLESNKDADKIHIYYIDNHISMDNRRRITNLVKQYRRAIEFIPMPSMEHLKQGQSIQTNIVIYSYCFLHELLPADVQKVILIESDTLVLGSLRELWEMDLSEYYIAAADDIKSKYYKRALGLQETSPYFNSGVFVANLKMWREETISPKMEAVIRGRAGRIFYEVQDEMNIVFESKVRIISPKYNCTTALFLFNFKNMLRYRKPTTCFTEEEFHEARQAPIILHFTRNHIIQSRPWMIDCEHPFKDVFIDIKNRTDFSDEQLWPYKRQPLDSLAHFVYKCFPQAIPAWILGVVQAWLFPLKIQLKGKQPG